MTTPSVRICSSCRVALGGLGTPKPAKASVIDAGRPGRTGFTTAEITCPGERRIATMIPSLGGSKPPKAARGWKRSSQSKKKIPEIIPLSHLQCTR